MILIMRVSCMLLNDIARILFSHIIASDQIPLLSLLIKEYLENFAALYPHRPLAPKCHYLLFCFSSGVVAEGGGDWVWGGGWGGKRLSLLLLVSGSLVLEACVPMTSLGVWEKWGCLWKTSIAGLVRTRQKGCKASHSYPQMVYLNSCRRCRHRYCHHCCHPRPRH